MERNNTHIRHLRPPILFWIIFSISQILVPAAVIQGHAAEYKIMAWNVEDMDIFDGQGMQRVPIQIKKEKAIASVIRKTNPNVMLMVEAPSLIEIHYFLEANNLAYQAAFQATKRKQGFCRWICPFDQGRSEVEKRFPGNPAAARQQHGAAKRYKDWSMRGLLVAEINEFTFIGVHLKSPTSRPEKDDLVKRLQQARGLVAYAMKIQGPVVIAGDFNDGPGIGPLEKRFALPDTIGLLETDFQRSAGDEKTHEGGFNIDHVMVHNGRTSRRTVVPTPWSLSDHRPVWVTISFD